MPNERQAPTANNYSPTSARSTLARRKKGEEGSREDTAQHRSQHKLSVVRSTTAVKKETEEREEKGGKGGSRTCKYTT